MECKYVVVNARPGQGSGGVIDLQPAALRPIQRHGSSPLWLQLKHALRNLITFDLQPGDQIPTEAQLCDSYALSRVTVRQAITSLVDEGLLERRQGRGTFVVVPRLAESLGEHEHFLLSGFDAARADTVSVFSQETVPVPEWIAARLGLTLDGPVFKIRKLLTVGAERVAFRTSYIPVEVAPTLLSSDLEPPLSLTLERTFCVHLSSAEETIEFIVADAFRAEMLKVAEEHPVILMERFLICTEGRGVECSRTFYKADRFRFRHRLVNPDRRGA